MAYQTIRLKRETMTGFIDRASNFRIGEGNTYRAERWVSDYFDVQQRESTPESRVEVHSVPPEKDDDVMTLKIETNPGFVDRGNNFQVRADDQASLTASRWVSGYFNARPMSE